jgi:[FeFe] hydrogenase (group B1/B3)
MYKRSSYMFTDNKTTFIKRTLMTSLARHFFEDTLLDEIESVPVEMIPKDGQPYRCCIYKDRMMVKYRVIALLGFSLENEFEIDTLPLSEYAKIAIEREKISFPILTFIDEACRSCVRANYVVTNMCQNCVARPCIVNCPKKAISTVNNQAYINPQLCVNCGICMGVCPFHAIVYMPVPCEEACPVGAISKNDAGKQVIDYNKCIFCGKCTMACPFGAVMEKSQIIDVIKHIKAGKEVAAMIAPSIIGQFDGSIGQIAGALKALGFSHVVEVALGADKTIEIESAEFCERLEKGNPFMGTSCCPAYTEAVKKHAQEFLPFVSHAETPMVYTGMIVKEHFPEALRVFIGPCVAKKHEDLNCKNVDYVLTFEELASLFEARAIRVNECKEAELEGGVPSREGRGFPVSTGVASAIREKLKDTVTVEPVFINGFTKANVKLLSRYAKEGCSGNLVEVMSCEGGCMAGPGVVTKLSKGTRKLKEFLQKGQ